MQRDNYIFSVKNFQLTRFFNSKNFTKKYLILNIVYNKKFKIKLQIFKMNLKNEQE